MKLYEFLALTHNRRNLIQFLNEVNVLKCTITCPKCNAVLEINQDDLTFRCRRNFYEKDKHKKMVRKQCAFRASATAGTWFSRSKLSLETVCRLTAYFIMMKPPRCIFLSNELDLSNHSIVNWVSFCQEVCTYWVDQHSTQLGGPGMVVEIDEAKIGNRKCNRGRLITGKWIFGGYERDTKRIFVVSVPDRTQETLLRVIKEWIRPGTTVVSDCWKSYDCLNNEGFQHLTVNHSMNFVDPETGGPTQHIERVWREVRANIPRYGTRLPHLVGYLSEFLFKRVHTHDERLLAFYRAIGELYPPKIIEEQP